MCLPLHIPPTMSAHLTHCLLPKNCLVMFDCLHQLLPPQ